MSVSKPFTENFAPLFLASVSTTCRSPRSTRTSVRASGSAFRREMASRCSLVLRARAFDQRFGIEVFRLGQDRGGHVDSIVAGLGGAIATGPRRIERSARDAVRLPRAAVCDADRQKRPIGFLAAICNAARLLATAAHGGREDRRGRYRAKQDRGYAGHSPKTVPAGISFHIDCLRRAVLAGNSVTCSVRP
jgi:hypothetical protein